MSSKTTLTLLSGIERLSIESRGDLALRGIDQTGLTVTYSGTTPPAGNDRRRRHTLPGRGWGGRPPAALNVRVVPGGDLTAANLEGDLEAAEVPGDSRLQMCQTVRLGRVAGDLASSLCRTVQVDHVTGDAQIQHATEVTLGQVKDDLVIQHAAHVTVAEVGSDCRITHSGPVTVESIGGDASFHHLEELHASSVKGDVSLQHVTAASVGAANDDVAASHVQDLVLSSVGGDLACTNLSGSAQIGRVRGDLSVNSFTGDFIVSDQVRGDVVIRSRVQRGQRLHLRAWGSVALVLNGSLNLHSLSGEGQWKSLPEWDAIRQQTPNPSQEGGAEVLIAAGDRLTAASYEVNMGELTDTLDQLGAQLSSLGVTIADQVRSGVAAADFRRHWSPDQGCLHRHRLEQHQKEHPRG
ncbi:MAG: hypothetical protein HZY76_06705 [Anaerolineae bacterium]|nr:MAG: hypothetical protein HZY76_06705 [Anaerolineae bacterium]